MCTNSVGQPLSYAIMSAPSHGTLGSVGATGQVTYTPAAGFSGNDSFTYDASSPSGTSSVQTVSITVATVGVASAMRGRANDTGVEVSVACPGAPGAHCRLTFVMTVTETLVRHTLVALSSGRSKRPRETKVVTVGRSSTVIPAGTTKVIRVLLNGAGRQLLASNGKLRVSLVLTQTAGSKHELVARQTLTLRTSGTEHNTPH
jgi:hypothetical protein